MVPKQKRKLCVFFQFLANKNEINVQWDKCLDFSLVLFYFNLFSLVAGLFVVVIFYFGRFFHFQIFTTIYSYQFKIWIKNKSTEISFSFNKCCFQKSNEKVKSKRLDIESVRWMFQTIVHMYRWYQCAYVSTSPNNNEILCSQKTNN